MRLEHWWYMIPLRLRSIVRRGRVEAELNDEFQFHIEQRIEQELAVGKTPEEARYAALRAMHGVEQQKEECRDMRRMNWIEDLIRDLRYALRALAKTPGFTAVAVLTLMLGIGTNTAIFSVIESVLLRPLPFHDSDRLFFIWSKSDRQGSARIGASGPDFDDYKAQNHSFEYLAEILPGFVYTWTGHGEPKTVHCTAISYDFFPMLGIQPFLGRFYTPQEYHTDGVQVVISFHFWKEQLGGNPDVIGRVLNLDNGAMTIIGVAPPVRQLFPETDIWAKVVPDFSWMHLRSNKLLTVMGRLKPGAARSQAEHDLTAILRRAPGEPPNVSVDLVPLKDEIVGNMRAQLEVLMAAVGLVLLIACVNVAYLLLARAIKRQPEIAVRLSMGAANSRILRQFIAENLLLASMGAGLGVALAFSVVQLIKRFDFGNLPRAQGIGIDGWVLVFTCFIALLTGVLLAWAPSTVFAKLNLNSILRTGRSEIGSSGRARLRALTVTEVCLAVVLLIAAGLLVRSFWKIEHIEPGFQPRHLLTAFLRTNDFSQEGGMFYNELLARLSQTPGVQAAAVGDCMPGTWAMQGTIRFDDRANDPYNAPAVESCWISGKFFRSLGTPLLRGRAFTAHDDARSKPVVIINRALAQRYWPGQNPIGKHLAVNYVGSGRQSAGTLRFREIVGVVGNVKQNGLDLPAKPALYTPFLQDETNHDFAGMNVFVRTLGNPGLLARAIRTEVHAVRPDQPVDMIRTMNDVLFRSLAPRRFGVIILGVFAILALLLSAIGIYGMIAYSVNQRTRELGLRMALGAHKSNILIMIMKEGLILTAGGIGLGVLVSLASTRAMAGLLFGVTSTDLPTFAVTTGLLLIIAALACLIPALRAASTNPMEALRAE